MSYKTQISIKAFIGKIIIIIQQQKNTNKKNKITLRLDQFSRKFNPTIKEEMLETLSFTGKRDNAVQLT